MKIQLDTINKTITIEEDVNLHDFYEELNSLLPSGLWREFTLKVAKITEWRNPITITPHTPINPFIPIGVPNEVNPYTSPQPSFYPQVWYTTSGTDSVTLNSGIYNITTKA
jgi:hypothetical protein